MSYTQNNPFSRKSSPLNKDDQWIQKATADIKKRGTEGVCTGDKFGGPTCPPGSKRYNLAKTFKSMAKDRKGGPSRESSEEKYMPIEDDMHKKGEGDMGMSRQPWGGNKHDYKRRDVEGVMKKTGDVDGHYKDYEGPSRKSSPLNNTGMTGLNYSKELRYNAIDDITQGKGEADYGFSRESSSPLDYGSWAHRDAERAKEKYAEGDYAWGRALGRDEHDADYAKHWHKDEAEHGTSRRSSSPLNKHDEWQKKIDAARAKDGGNPDFYEKYAHLYKAQEKARLAHKK